MDPAKSLSLALLLALALPCFSTQQPVGQWEFDASRLRDKALLPTAGPWQGKALSSAAISGDKPSALAANNGFGGIMLHEDISKAGLPKEAISVTAWARVDKPIEWGGILGAIQDNGSFERGWLLGYGKDSFYFAIASEGAKRLTYLKSTTVYSPNFWYHLAGTYDSKLQRIYIDGKMVGESKVQNGDIFYPPSGKFMLGAYHDDNEQYPMEGQIESIQLWDRALSAEEVNRLFKAKKERFPSIEPVTETVATEDWPTFLHDNERTGVGAPSIKGKLSLRWTHRMRAAPQAAWPPPAKQDFWHKKYKLQPRVTYDRAFHMVGAGNRIYLASSADDQARCLSLVDGRELWTHFAGAPIRLAPTLAGNRLLIGADDGNIRCVQTSDGKLLWKTQPPDLGSRIIPGNGRMIHQHPIRTGILVDGQTAYCGAGLFPTQGTFLFSLDIRNGHLLDQQKLSISPQGYLSRRNGKLFAPTGRDPAGAFLRNLNRRGKPTPLPAKAIPEKYPYAFIGAGELRFAGGEDEVAVFRGDGSLDQTLAVTGKAYGLAVVRGNLLVSTDAGVIHCFSTGAGKAIHREPAPLKKFPANLTLARAALATTPTTKGYCLVVGAKHASLAASIAELSEMRAIVSEKDPATVDQLRRSLAAAGLYGNEVVVHLKDGKGALPYGDHLFNLLLDPDNLLTKDETLRVLRPMDGKALAGGGLRKTLSKPAIDGGGEWSHLYADPGNTACSKDQKVGAELNLQWFGRPGPERLIDRHHRSVSPLWKNGFLYIPGNERIFGVDAYNGTVLWETEVPDSRRIAIMRDCGSMAADNGFIYVASGRQCLGLAARTGKVDRQFTIPDKALAASHEWGYVARLDDLLIGSAVKDGAIRRVYGHEGIQQTYWDNRPPVCSDMIFAIEAATGKSRWSYRPNGAGAVVNSSIALKAGKVHLIESEANTESGRVPYDKILDEKGGSLVTLDLKTGKLLKRIALSKKKSVQNLYLLTAQGVVSVVNSRNEKTVRYDVRTFDAKSGKLLWEQTQNNGNKLNGDHGEQDRHPVIMNDEIYVEPFIYNLKSGQTVTGRKLSRGRGCGALSASANALYFRSNNPTAYLPSTGKFKKITTVSRPGCWINAIPAGGLLLIPEASSGCTCAFAIQCSLAFAPKKPAKKP